MTARDHQETMDLRKDQRSLKGYGRVIRTTCAFCPVGCGIKAYVSGPQLVDLWGDETHPINKGALCPRGSAAYQHVSHPSRCIHPMVRESFDQDFKRVPWEKALTYISGRLKKIRDRYGPQSLHIHLSHPYDFGNLMSAERFGSIFETPFISHPVLPQRNSERRDSLFSMLGVPGRGISMNYPPDWVHSKTILIVGADIAATQPVNMGWVLDAKERGAKLIGIDSRLSTTMSKTDHFLICRPGAESAVLMAMARVIIEKGLYRKEFLGKWTKGISGWMEKCNQYTPERVEKVSWVPSGKIREAARYLATHWPSQIMTMDQFGSPFEDSRLIESSFGLLCLTGGIGISGGGLNLLSNFPPINPLSDLQGMARQGTSVENLPCHDWIGADHGNTGRKIRAMIWDGDSLHRCMGSKRFSEIKGNLDLVVHLSHFPNSSWSCSHVSLPMASWLESEGVVAYGSTRSLQWHNQVIPSPGACRTYSDFWAALADRLGWGDLFPWMAHDHGVDIRKMSDFFLRHGELTKGCSVETLDPEKNEPGGILWPCPEKGGISSVPRKAIKGEAILFQKGSHFPATKKRFPTPSGKIEFSMVRKGEKGTDLGLTPDRIQGLPKKGYSLFLTTGIPINQIEGLGFWLPWLNETKPPLFVQIHPETAGVLEIQDGDRVLIENTMASIEGLARVTSSVAPKVVWCPGGTDETQPYLAFQNVEALAERRDSGPLISRLHGIPVLVYRKGTDPQVMVRRLWDHFPS